MARADLSSLLDKMPPTDPPADSPAKTAPAPEVVREHPEERPTEPPREDADASYLAFVRKDTRLREDQLEALTRHARRLGRAKRNNGVRITENTLIRIGVDLLLDRIEKATGDDEVALRRSLR